MKIERNVFMAGRPSKTHPYKAVRENGEVICYGKTKTETLDKAIAAMEDTMDHCLTTPVVGVTKDGRILVGRIWAKGEVYLQWFNETTREPEASTVGKLDGNIRGMVAKYVQDYDEAMGYPAGPGPCEHEYSYETYPAGKCKKCGAHD